MSDEETKEMELFVESIINMHKKPNNFVVLDYGIDKTPIKLLGKYSERIVISKGDSKILYDEIYYNLTKTP